MKRQFHRSKLPDHSTLLSGRTPRDEVGFLSNGLQVWYNNTEETWVETPEPLHCHQKSDEMFVVLRNALHVEVEGAVNRIGPREFCCFPVGEWHSIVRVELPAETLMIRAPSVADKVYKE